MNTRTIKFRAWDKDSKEMIPLSNIDFDHNIMNKGSLWKSLYNVELMQYTGFKDKNGKEIYEGDVLYKDFQKSKKPNLIGDVFSENGSYIWKYKEEGNDIWYAGFLGDSGVSEVIGNIYENPELVKV